MESPKELPLCQPATEFQNFAQSLLTGLSSHPSRKKIAVALKHPTAVYEAEYKDPPWFHYPAINSQHICTSKVYAFAKATIEMAAAVQQQPAAQRLTDAEIERRVQKRIRQELGLE